MWGLWIEHHLLLSVGSSTHWRNLRTSNRIAVHVGDPHTVFAWRAAPNERAQTAPFPLAAGKWIVRNDA